MSAILLAAKINCFEICEWIVQKYGSKRINLFARDYEGNTVLHHAVLNKNMSLIKLFFSIDEMQCLIKNHQGKSPFFLAVETQNFEVVKTVFREHHQAALL